MFLVTGSTSNLDTLKILDALRLKLFVIPNLIKTEMTDHFIFLMGILLVRIIVGLFEGDEKIFELKNQPSDRNKKLSNDELRMNTLICNGEAFEETITLKQVMVLETKLNAPIVNGITLLEKINNVTYPFEKWEMQNDLTISSHYWLKNYKSQTSYDTPCYNRPRNLTFCHVLN